MTHSTNRFKRLFADMTVSEALEQLNKRQTDALVYGVVLDTTGVVLSLIDDRMCRTWFERGPNVRLLEPQILLPPLLTLPEAEALSLSDIANFFQDDFANDFNILGIVLLNSEEEPKAIITRETLFPIGVRNEDKHEFFRGLEDASAYLIAPEYLVEASPDNDNENPIKKVLQVTRYGQIQFPAQVQLGVAYELTISITRQSSLDGKNQVELGLKRRDWPLLVAANLVGVRKEDFLIASLSYGVLEVQRMQDSNTLSFMLIPQSLGKKDIFIQFEQWGEQQYDYLITASIHTEVVVAQVEQVSSAAVYHAPTIHTMCAPPDVTLYIKRITDLRYNIYARTIRDKDRGDGELPLIDEIDFPQPPDAYMKAIYADLNKETGEGLSQSEVKLIGNNLYHKLFHEDRFKRFYRDVLNELSQGATVQIISDEPYIPWELLRPFHTLADGTRKSDPYYFCERFALSRWLSESPPRVTDLPFLKVILVVPPSNLRWVEEEVEAIKNIPGVVVEVVRDKQKLETFFTTGEADIVHFACHNAFHSDIPGRSRLQLGDSFLHPDDLVAENMNFGHVHPLVFLNACESAQQGVGLTRLDGWTKAFLDAGAGFFLGALWKTQDNLAYEFAYTFYERLLAGNCVADAMRQARYAVFTPDDATYLSYVLYAHPRASTRSGKKR